ncbi:fumarylacetoacetate hydrolase family protein [Gynuella sunshinyii]|uniref:2-keto-4-pentenoate hydratase/2-oxohepta-3-ene-1,7-dioic acid hydratase (Catechol pathway) n=1 Tax=Gynuella sunshinyii YC6258 TaxID=1445510 RepID=A0A0C5W4Z9_9GAMM|nr:fumarylacetoacetate hydrolase family protein [Gynuella sunshinyii]AJQ97679.1 2-keto-4-pentenoate hydratase/2-oxohepta-3-ene-1,7-dioic acid hydratase (catechol pathway) [Gynuella sunshinyii YC6258]
MRFATYRHHHQSHWGMVISDPAGDRVAKLDHVAPSLKAAIQANLLSTIETRDLNTIPIDEVTLLPPIDAPEKIFCIGVNYANRNAEYKDGSDDPIKPSVFIRLADSFTGHKQPLIRPPESIQLDYEGEIVVVIGKAGRRIKREQAFEHIAGLTLMNEGTLRDWVRHAKFNVTQGKNFERSGSIGPWMVTADEFSAKALEQLQLETRVNGEVRQSDSTASMMFPIAFIIEYLSTFCTLRPGDIIATGTPNGAGARFDPPRYLKPGDVVEVSVAGIGTLVNGVMDEEL